MTQYTASQLVFSDESAYDKRTLSRRYGWSLTGHRARKSTFFVRGKRYTIVHQWPSCIWYSRRIYGFL